MTDPYVIAATAIAYVAYVAIGVGVGSITTSLMGLQPGYRGDSFAIVTAVIGWPVVAVVGVVAVTFEALAGVTAWLADHLPRWLS